MFEIGWTELLVVAVVAIVVIGPKDLPRAMRIVGQWTGRMKRMARDFQNQFNEAVREADLEDVKKDVEEIGKGMRADINKIDAGVRDDMKKIDAGLQVPPDTAAAPSTTPAPAPEPAPAAEVATAATAESAPAAKDAP